MMSMYTGTPGSGKSLRMAHEVIFQIKTLKKNVIANTSINRDFILRGASGGRFFYLDNSYLSNPDFFYKYALRYHVEGKEHQTLIIFDEAQIMFSPKSVKLLCQVDPYYRSNWLEFFTQHRHLGYDILFISQFDKLIDPQFRCLCEYNYVHRKANNFKTIGKLFSIFHINLFVQIQYWYGSNQVCGNNYFTYTKKMSKVYNSYTFRAQMIAKLRKKYGDDLVEQLLDPTGWNQKRKELLKLQEDEKVS